MISKIPPEFTIPTRRTLVDKYKQLYRIRNPNIDVSDGGEPDIKARVAADSLLPFAAQAKKISDCAIVATAFGDAVATWGEIHGVERGAAAGATGFVKIRASSGGGFIQEGDPLYVKNQSTGPRFECTIGRTYFDGEPVPIRSAGVGFETNLPAKTVLVWSTNIPGIHPEATVFGQDGVGLTGGRPPATPERHKLAILAKLNDPPGAGNAAHYRFEAKRAGVAIDQAFTYSAVKGACVIGLAFVVPPASRAGTRVPLEDQTRIVGDHLELAFGADDGILMTQIVEQPVKVSYRVAWKTANEGWADTPPWPEYADVGSGAIVVSSVTDALNFVLKADDNDYTDVDDPQAGQTIAFYDTASGRFARKRIDDVSGSGPWTITVATANSVSDEEYVPVVDQRVSPWSVNLDNLATVVVEMFARLGPGEVVTTPSTDGVRRVRVPLAPERWPHTLTQSLLENEVDAERIPSLFDREVVEGDGSSPTIGTPGVTAYMLTLGDLGVYEKP